MFPHASEPKNPRILLETDHRHIERLIERVQVQVRSEDYLRAQKAWRRLEEAILAHFDVEEMYVLPELAASAPAEVRKIREEHAAMRQRLGELGMAVELHAMRSEALDAFAAEIRAHAEREESLLYVFAERHAPVSAARSIFARLKSAIAPAKRRGTTAEGHRVLARPHERVTA